LPKRYRDWKTDAIAYLKTQYQPETPLSRVTIDVALFGSHRGDLDNIVGSILDALVQADILQDDRLSVVTAIAIRHYPAKNLKTIITIQPS
jgi:Holliday junction resolvase RusA-like endonuclease